MILTFISKSKFRIVGNKYTGWSYCTGENLAALVYETQEKNWGVVLNYQLTRFYANLNNIMSYFSKKIKFISMIRKIPTLFAKLWLFFVVAKYY